MIHQAAIGLGTSTNFLELFCAPDKGSNTRSVPLSAIPKIAGGEAETRARRSKSRALTPPPFEAGSR